MTPSTLNARTSAGIPHHTAPALRTRAFTRPIDPEAPFGVQLHGIAGAVPHPVPIADLVLAVGLRVVQVTGQHVRARDYYLPNFPR